MGDRPILFSAPMVLVLLDGRTHDEFPAPKPAESP